MGRSSHRDVHLDVEVDARPGFTTPEGGTIRKSKFAIELTCYRLAMLMGPGPLGTPRHHYYYNPPEFLHSTRKEITDFSRTTENSRNPVESGSETDVREVRGG